MRLKLLLVEKRNLFHRVWRQDVMSKEPMEEVVQVNIDIVDDPLDLFMVDVHDEYHDDEPYAMEEEDEFKKVRIKGSGDESEIGSDPEDIIAAAAKRLAAKKKDLTLVNHNLIAYELFQKDFFIEAPKLAALTKEEDEIIRLELDRIKIHGTNCPKPPSPIQAQAIPAIMSQDCISIAKTGSGKTICFLLPTFRHIKDQRPLDAGEGPIGLVMTPTRELAVQIHKECEIFTKVLGLRVICIWRIPQRPD
ncbi:pre-mRNA processing RNA-helicase [Nowakowskiella sp. JEL0078]|nr:pre-mRNA processing RNA-helicase [Nowakowskiella sp. JEL0078]